VLRYRNKISGPLLDRIDMQAMVPAMTSDELRQHRNGEPSSHVLARVERARALMQARQGKSNARLEPHEVESHCVPDVAAGATLSRAISQLGLSARGYHRLLRVARTIADLAGATTIMREHVAEAIGYRQGLG